MQMNHIFIGTAHVKLPESGFLYLNDQVPLIPRARYFDYRKHSFNILHNLTYRKICDIVDTFEALFRETDGTLTEGFGLTYIAKQLSQQPTSFDTLIPEPDKKSGTGHLWAHDKLQRLLLSPVLRQVLCNPKPNFTGGQTVFARLNRAELGDFDALALGLFLIAQWKSAVVLPDLGFYGRDMHTAIIRENRIVAGVEDLSDLLDKLRRRVLKIPEPVIAGALHDDAIELAKYARTPEGQIIAPGTDGYSSFILDAMRPPPEPEPVQLWTPPPLTKPQVQPKTVKRTWRGRDPYAA